jgi:hypothetical protein
VSEPVTLGAVWAALQETYGDRLNLLLEAPVWAEAGVTDPLISFVVGLCEGKTDLAEISPATEVSEETALALRRCVELAMAVQLEAIAERQ